MSVRILKSKVVLEAIGAVEISTVDLSSHSVRWLTGYETCLFWGTESEIVDSYPTWDAAVQGHAEWKSAEKVARALHVLYCDHINH